MSLGTVLMEQVQPPWTALRQFARRRPPVERCELCSLALGPEHPHLVEAATRKLICACDACAVLFDRDQAGRYRRVPRDTRYLPDFQLSDVQWNALSIPVGLAFFFHSTAAGRVVAIYPSPAGATESLLDLDAWGDIVHDNPVLASIEPDVEALLVNRVGQAREHYLAPIDQCYRLVGLLRTHWRGISGGSEVWQEIERFFARLKRQA